VENPDLISESFKELYEDVKTFIEKDGFNILNSSVTDEKIHMFIQTKEGLEELIIDDELFTNNLYQEALYIYEKITKMNMVGFDDKDPIEVLEEIEKNAKKGAYIQRYKGLGEMNPEQLWETTMNPENRRLLQVRIENFDNASGIFSLFMGDEVEPRRQYIQEHAKDVKYLDV
jgi:DNA gyrase subunit B